VECSVADAVHGERDALGSRVLVFKGIVPAGALGGFPARRPVQLLPVEVGHTRRGIHGWFRGVAARVSLARGDARGHGQRCREDDHGEGPVTDSPRQMCSMARSTSHRSTSVRATPRMTTDCALCTAIPMSALLYRLDG
jgi:hypothetical protein